MTEFAWLIEDAESEVANPRYWMGGIEGECIWTTDHEKAVRFARRIDAHRVGLGVLIGCVRGIRVCEHGWD